MGDFDTFTFDFQLLILVIFIMDLNVATFEQLKNLPSIWEHRAHAILDVRAHLDRDLTLLDLILEAGIPGDVMRSIIYGKLIVSVPHHEGELVDRVHDNNEEDLDGFAADEGGHSGCIGSDNKGNGTVMRIS